MTSPSVTGPIEMLATDGPLPGSFWKPSEAPLLARSGLVHAAEATGKDRECQAKMRARAERTKVPEKVRSGGPLFVA